MFTLIFIFSGLFSTKTFKQHRVMVPCWPLCWASLAPAAQHESDNQGIVHLTPSSSTFSHHGCVLYCVLLYSVLYTPHPQLFLLLTSRRVEPKNLRIIRNLSSQPQVGSGSPFSHFTPFGIFTTQDLNETAGK